MEFERYISRRAVNQQNDGTFTANASKTVKGEQGDVASIAVDINSRTPRKTTLAVNVWKLPDAEAKDRYKALFKQLLAEFAAEF